MTDDELFEDLACLGQLQRVEGSQHPVKRSSVFFRVEAKELRPSSRRTSVGLTQWVGSRGKTKGLHRLGEDTLPILVQLLSQALVRKEVCQNFTQCPLQDLVTVPLFVNCHTTAEELIPNLIMFDLINETGRDPHLRGDGAPGSLH